jgi:hypothetical protein
MVEGEVIELDLDLVRIRHRRIGGDQRPGSPAMCGRDEPQEHDA